MEKKVEKYRQTFCQVLIWELCVCQLSGILDVSQPKVSKNLSKLRDMNMVIDDRKEKFVYYRLKTDNAVLTKTVDNILRGMDEYPQLILDKNRLREKEKQLNQCCMDL